MSPLAELLLAISIVGLLVLLVCGFWRKRNLPRLILQLLFLAAFVIVLHIIFGFPRTLLWFNGSTVSKGTDSDAADWPIYVISYACMVAGMLCHYLYSRFSTEAAHRPPFDWGSFVAPIFVSPIIFVPLCSTVSLGDRAEAGRYMIFLVAFENGFFFKGYFNQRGQAGRATPG